jgi:hypothetical protein
VALIGLNYSSEIPRSLILDLLLTACFFLEFLHTFAFKRLGQMHPLERPLWYSDSPIPTCSCFIEAAPGQLSDANVQADILAF